jgi:adenylate kinase family enzyme
MTESPIGRRIHVIGNSGSGKSTLGARLALVLEIPFVELDALNWEPGWIGLNEADPAEFERRIREATSGEAWVVAGS